MNFLQMKQDLADRLSSFDETVSADSTRLGRWINRAQDNICCAWNWPFNRQVDIIQTQPDYTTGTVAITQGTTTLTFSSGPASSLAGWYIKIGDLADWYLISTHTAGATTATITPTFRQTTVTTSTFLARKFNYQLAANAMTVMDVRIATNYRNMMSLPAIQCDMLTQMLSGSGTPSSYFLTTPSVDGSPQIAFFPNPDTYYNIYVHEKQILTELVSDSDTPIIPAPYHDLITCLASYYGFVKVNSIDRAAMVKKEYDEGLEEMKKVYGQDRGRSRVVKPIDGEGGRDMMGPTLPPEYGPMSWR